MYWKCSLTKEKGRIGCAAASTEGLKTSADAVYSMDECRRILESICLLAQDLSQSTEEK